MNMYLHELKANRKSTIIWTCALLAISLMYITMFPAIVSDAAAFKKALENYPEVMRKALGVSLDSITTFLGFYSFTFGIIIIVGAIQAMNLGTSIVSKEVRDKTADFLLTKPVSRAQIMTSKLLAALTLLLVTNIIYLIITGVTATSVSKNPFSINIFIMISLSMLFVQLMFFSIGVIISVIARKIKSVLPISLSVVFGFYFIGAFGSVVSEQGYRYFTPFKYFDPLYIINHSAYEVSFSVIAALFIAFSTAISYSVYVNKDIHAV